MNRAVVWSQDAIKDITVQATYIAQDNKKAALRVGEAIQSAGKKLGDHSTGRPGRVEGTYEKSVTGLPYIIVYLILGTDAGEAVFIVHVVHTARKWP